MATPLRRVLAGPVATNLRPIQDTLDPAPDPRPGLGLLRHKGSRTRITSVTPTSATGILPMTGDAYVASEARHWSRCCRCASLVHWQR